MFNFLNLNKFSDSRKENVKMNMYSPRSKLSKNMAMLKKSKRSLKLESKRHRKNSCQKIEADFFWQLVLVPGTGHLCSYLKMKINAKIIMRIR